MACLRKFSSLLFFILVFSVLFIHVAPLAHAQTSSYITPNVDANVPADQHTLVQSLFIEVNAAIICQLINIDVLNPQHQCIQPNPETGKLGYASPTLASFGVVGMLSSSIQGMYAIPINSSQYTSYIGSRFGLSPAYAASSTGTEQLAPLLTLWLTLRNIAYLFFVMIFILLGIGVMLRFKLDPRTVMTLQSQIPKIIITLLLISFSYAISGLLVDLMWTTTYIGINTLDSVKKPDGSAYFDSGIATRQLLSNPVGYFNAIIPSTVTAGPVGGIPGLSANVSGSVGDVLASIVGGKKYEFDGGAFAKCTIAVVGGSIGGGLIGGPVGAALGGLLTNKLIDPNCPQTIAVNVIKGVVPLLAYLIVILIFIIALLRIWWLLIQAYIKITVYTIISPVYIMMGVLPGSTLGFAPWMRAMIANLLVFPATVLGLIVTLIIMQTFGNGQGFTPPLIGAPGVSGGLGYVVGLGFLLIIPQMTKVLYDALKTKPNPYVTPAIMGGITGATGLVMPQVSKGWATLTKRGEFGPEGKLAILGYRAKQGISNKASTMRGKIGTAVGSIPVGKPQTAGGQPQTLSGFASSVGSSVRGSGFISTISKKRADFASNLTASNVTERILQERARNRQITTDREKNILTNGGIDWNTGLKNNDRLLKDLRDTNRSFSLTREEVKRLVTTSTTPLTADDKQRLTDAKYDPATGDPI